MKHQSKTSGAYLFRNFLRLAPIGLPVAILLGLFFNVNSEISFVRGLVDGTVTSENVISELMNAISVLRFGNKWWLALITLALYAFTESLLACKIERHMRVGEMPLLPFKRACEIFPATLLFVFGVAFVVELLDLTAVGIAFLLKGSAPIVIVVFGIAATYFVRILATVITGMLLLAFPIVILENYSFNNALSYSVRLMTENRRYLWFFATAYPLCRLISCVGCYFADNEFVTVIVFAVFFLFMLLIVPCVAFKLYYDTVGGERKDLKVMMFRR